MLFNTIYILFTNIAETFWYRHAADRRVLAHFELKIHKDSRTISSLCVLICFK